MRFGYSDQTNTIFAFKQQKNVVEVISVANGSLVLSQTISILNGSVITIRAQKREDIWMVSNGSMLLLYQKGSNGSYYQVSSVSFGTKVYDQILSEDGLYLAIGGTASVVKVYQRVNNTLNFTYLQSLPSTNSYVQSMVMMQGH